jgi:molecular chaperone GrpE
VTEHSSETSSEPSPTPDAAEGIQDEPSSAVTTDPLEQALAEASQMKEKWMRTAADFDNYRKRSRREVVEAEKKGRDNLVRDLLPVFDNLERATAHAGATSATQEDPQGVKGLVDGISLVTKQFQDALGRLGIERVDSVGQPFDPSLHEAIQHLETTEVPPGCVAAEVQPGYRDGDRLLRPALVVVAKAPVSAEPREANSDASTPGAGTENPSGA